MLAALCIELWVPRDSELRSYLRSYLWLYSVRAVRNSCYNISVSHVPWSLCPNILQMSIWHIRIWTKGPKMSIIYHSAKLYSIGHLALLIIPMDSRTWKHHGMTQPQRHRSHHMCERTIILSLSYFNNHRKNTQNTKTVKKTHAQI